jgi:hypothetical protein
MTVYAASSIDYVAVSADGHGGCGSSHRRPVVDGAPVHPWALTCPSCEDHLRTDPLWSSTLAELPETYDEKLAREDFEKRGVTDERALMAMALAKMTGLELPETLAARITGAKPHIPGATAACADGHVNPATAKFCTECGQPMGAKAPEPPARLSPEKDAPIADPSADPPPFTAASAEPGPAAPAAKPPTNREIRDMKRADLVTLARSRGLPDTGSRADLIGRLLKAASV